MYNLEVIKKLKRTTITKSDVIEKSIDSFKNCITKTEFKKKYSYLYKKCIHYGVLNIVFNGYDNLMAIYKKDAQKYSINDILSIAKNMTKSEFMQTHRRLYNILTKYYNYQEKIIFRKRF